MWFKKKEKATFTDTYQSLCAVKDCVRYSEDWKIREWENGLITIGTPEGAPFLKTGRWISPYLSHVGSPQCLMCRFFIPLDNYRT